MWYKRDSTKNRSKLFNLLSFRLPFDSKSPIRYFCAILLQMRAIVTPLRIIGIGTSMGFTNTLFAITFAEDIKDAIHSINDDVHAQLPQSYIHARIAEIVRFSSIRRFDFIDFICVICLFE